MKYKKLIFEKLIQICIKVFNQMIIRKKIMKVKLYKQNWIQQLMKIAIVILLRKCRVIKIQVNQIKIQVNQIKNLNKKNNQIKRINKILRMIK